MRDPARIDTVLDEVRRVWAAEPDLRLGQLLIIAARPSRPCPELFYLEDEELLKRLSRYAQRGRRAGSDDAPPASRA